jgi:hypothetical protein
VRGHAQRQRLPAQDPGSCRRRRLGGDQVDGALVGVERLGAVRARQVPAQPLGEEPGADRLGGRVHVLQGGANQRDGALQVAGEVRRLGGLPQQPGPVQRQRGGDVGDLVPQVEGAFEVVLRFGEGQGLLGRLAGGDRCRERLGEVVGFVPVRCQLGGGLRGRAAGQLRLGGEAVGDGGVEVATFAG